MLSEFELAIRGKRRPYIVAEMSGNHNGSLDQALAIVDAAADSGADAIKLQTYTADTMTLNLDSPVFKITDPSSLWFGRSLYDLYEEAHTPWEWHEPIFNRARERGLLPFSTPFDATSVDFLEGLDVEIFKIASFENTDLELIAKVAATGKPMIVSTGLASVEELAEAVSTARNSGSGPLVLLKTTSSYPATPENTNIRTIPHLADLFGTPVGLSDHTLGIGVAVGSVALGAVVIEKHVTLNRSDGGVDSAFSLVPEELKSLVRESERAWLAVGNVAYGSTESESGSYLFRRSLFITENLKEGDVLTIENVRAIRPGTGLPTKYLKIVLGRKVRRAVGKGTPVSWDLI
jgi:N-acetylneuraminate synthase